MRCGSLQFSFYAYKLLDFTFHAKRTKSSINAQILIKCAAVRCNFCFLLINFLFSLSTWSVSLFFLFFHAKRVSFLHLFRVESSIQHILNLPFISPKNFLFHFLHWRITTEAMGIWRFAGAFTVAQRQGECGSKTAEMHVNQPMNIGVC